MGYAMRIAGLFHEHTPEAIRARLARGPQPSYLRDWIYGGIDGAVTTFAIVSGVVGAHLATGIILVLGAANIVADGFSMAASNYTGTKSEREEYDRIRAYEEHQIVHDRAGEIQEVREIYRAKGFDGDDLERAVEIIAPKDGTTSYSNAKRALAQAIRRRALEWGGLGIRLNAVAPGKMETPMLDGLLARPEFAPTIDALPVGLGRSAPPDEMAAVVVFLLGREASYVHGQVLFVDGGSDAVVRPDRV